MFVFLAGTGAYLQLVRAKSKRDVSKFLLTRGLWLIVLELTFVRFGVFFNLDYRTPVSCLPTCQSAGNPPKYPPIKSGDYLLSRFRDVQKYRGAAA